MTGRRQLVMFCAAVLVGMSSSLHAQLKAPRSASDLVSLCTSTNPDQLAYCEGYITGAAHRWKVSAACRSPVPGDKSFCAGSKAAYDKTHETLENCKYCGGDRSQPDFVERMRRFRDELKVALGVCSPSSEWERRKEYCAGYNDEAATTIASFAAALLEDERRSARDQGLGDADAAARGIMASEFYYIAPITKASEYYIAFVPCLERSVLPDEMRKTLIEFVHDYPEQLRIGDPIFLLEEAMFYGVCPGPQSGFKPQMELCTTWNYDGGQYGTKNTCDKPVVIKFVATGRDAIEREVSPGGDFRTGLSMSDITGGAGFLYTVCPAGYKSSVPIESGNGEERDAISKGLYSCVRK
jgi:hypothetical protein